jgi:hypothetical protein
LILDVTCVPDDIPYPVDLRLLNEAREVTETIIDKLFKQLQGKIDRKPRCTATRLAIFFSPSSKRRSLRKTKFERLNGFS